MDSLEEIKQKRKRQQDIMANALMQSGKQPTTLGQALSPAMMILASQAQDKGLATQEQQAQERYRNTLAQALSPMETAKAVPAKTDLDELGQSYELSPAIPAQTRPRTQQEMLSMLLSNPDTASLGTHILTTQADKQAATEAKLPELKFQSDLRSQEKQESDRRHADLMRELQEQRLAVQKAIADKKLGGKGQLPPQALKLQQEELDAIGTFSSINADLGALEKQLDSGELKFGPVSNLKNKAKNATGLADQKSTNFASFQSTLEKLRNDSLRLNKGVQTEGDAQRAWNEIIANINDPKVVKQRLQEVRRINERAANLRKMNVDVIRSNYGLDSLDTDPYENQPAAVGKGGSLSKEEQSELETLRKRFGKQ